MPAVDEVLSALRQELVAAELVRYPFTVAAAPPCHIEPREGAPAPGEREAPQDHAGLVVSLLHSGDLGEATGWDASLRRRSIIDVRFRSADNSDLRAAQRLDQAIRNRLIRRETSYGYGFLMGTDTPVLVHAAGVFAGFGIISRVPGQAYDHVAKYSFEVAP